MDVIDKLNAIIAKKPPFVFKEIKMEGVSQIYNETIVEVIQEAIEEIKKLRKNEVYSDQFMKKFMTKR